MTAKTFVILGATGNVGGPLAEQLLAKGHKVRAIGRDRAKLESLSAKGAQIVAAERFDRNDSWARSFDGADAVFSFIPPGMQADDYGVFQDEVGEAIRSAVAAHGVRRVLNLSSIGADLPEGTGPIKGLHRHEKRLNSLSGVDVLHLRPSYYMENLLIAIPLIKQMGLSGSPLVGDVPVEMVAARDVGIKAAALLDEGTFRGQSVFELEGPRAWTMTEATAVLGAAIGKPDLKYMQFAYDAARMGMIGSGLKPGLVDLVIEMNKAFNDGIVRPTQEITAEHRGSTTLDEFAPVFARAFGAPAGAHSA